MRLPERIVVTAFLIVSLAVTWIMAEITIGTGYHLVTGDDQAILVNDNGRAVSSNHLLTSTEGLWAKLFGTAITRTQVSLDADSTAASPDDGSGLKMPGVDFTWDGTAQAMVLTSDLYVDGAITQPDPGDGLRGMSLTANSALSTIGFTSTTRKLQPTSSGWYDVTSDGTAVTSDRIPTEGDIGGVYMPPRATGIGVLIWSNAGGASSDTGTEACALHSTYGGTAMLCYSTYSKTSEEDCSHVFSSETFYALCYYPPPGS